MSKILSFLLVLMPLLFLTCKDDPCEGVDCGERGRCVNGICECELGYGGAACNTPQMPRKMRLSNIRVLAWPQSDNGVGWDPLDAPDIYMVISESGSTSSIFTSGVSVNISGPPITYSATVTLDDPAEMYVIGLWDQDTFDPDDYMGSIIWSPGQYAMGRDFPSKAVLDLSDQNGISVEVSIEYEF